MLWDVVAGAAAPRRRRMYLAVPHKGLRSSQPKPAGRRRYDAGNAHTTADVSDASKGFLLQARYRRSARDKPKGFTPR